MFFLMEQADLIKLLLAIGVGGAIGAEREFRDKSAGFRTMIFICVGACLFTLFSLKIGRVEEDAVRIAANVVSGVGFLGAGAIIQGKDKVAGLTTAATIWLVAALGMGIAGGHVALVLTGAGAILVVLWFFPLLEHVIDRIQEVNTYEVTCTIDNDVYADLDAVVKGTKLKVFDRKRTRNANEMVCTWVMAGSPKAHDDLAEKFFSHPAVIEFKV